MTGHRDEEGFTLVELALSAAILSLIVASISGAMIVFFSNAAYTTQRDDHSGGAAVLASYLDRDLASADAADFAAPSAPCSTGPKDLLLTWPEWTASPGDVTPQPGDSYAVAYDLVDDGDGRFQLERLYCKGTELVDDVVLLDGLAGGDFVLAPEGACGAASTSVVVSLTAYADDSNAGSYSYSGCLQGRLS